MTQVDEATANTITPEKVAAMKARIGIPRPNRIPPFNSEAHIDTIRHYVYALGDDNPLFCEPEYAQRTRWGGVIAPPRYITTLAVNEVPRLPEEQRQKGDPLRGLHAFYSSVDWDWYAPVRPGDRISVYAYLHDVQEKRSEFGGASVVVTWGYRYKNQRDEVIAVSREHIIHAARGKAAEKGKETRVEPARYTREDLEAIDRAYEAEQRRGAEPRYWEDVQVGEDIPQIVKGPLTVTDIAGHLIGSTFGAFGTRPLRLGYENRKRIPAFYVENEFGIPESAMNCHWDDAWAQRVGAARAYDFGAMRENWLYHLLTNWMGDDGALFTSHVEFRKFNYLGDTQWCRGRVVDKRREGDLNCVAVDVWCENQRGEITTPGSAVVLLPSRERGPVRLPTPPADLP